MARGMSVIDPEVASEPSSTAGNDNHRFLRDIVSGGDSNKTRVLSIFLISAIIIILARLLAPFEVGKDQALQLEAAGRLSSGLGLTSTYFTTPHPADISTAPEPVHLTWWPPALSVLVAGFLALGIPLEVSLKMIYGVITLIGWIGWAIIASHFLAKPVTLGRRSYPVQFIIAAFLPIVATPLWQGTDIFLWAGIPLVALWLLRSRESGSFVPYIVLAGLTFGFLYSVRYASAFLGLAALLILAQANLPNIKAVIKKSSVFIISSLLVIVPTLLYIKLFSRHDSVLPEYFDTLHKTSNLQALLGLVNGTRVTSVLLFGSNLFYLALLKLPTILSNAIGVCCFIAIILLPYIVLRRSAVSRKEYQKDIALTLSLLPLSLVVFLIASSLMARSHLFGIERYYKPLMLCCPLIFYEIAASKSLNRVLRGVSITFLFMFAFYICIFIPISGLSGERQARLVQTILSYTPSRSPGQSSTSQAINYPSRQIYSLKENSRSKVRELAQAYPGAIFYLANQAYFIYETDSLHPDGAKPGITFRRLPRRVFWNSAFTSKPVRVFWVLDQDTRFDFVPDSNLKLVYSDPYEKTRILESEFPAGYRFFNDAEAQPSPPQPQRP
jgi:hypothetical protein